MQYIILSNNKTSVLSNVIYIYLFIFIYICFIYLDLNFNAVQPREIFIIYYFNLNFVSGFHNNLLSISQAINPLNYYTVLTEF